MHHSFPLITVTKAFMGPGPGLGLGLTEESRLVPALERLQVQGTDPSVGPRDRGTPRG